APTGDNLGNHTATTALNMNGNVINSVPQINVTPGDGNGIRFWSSDDYKIHMGNSGEYHYGPVTDYSIKMNMNNQAGPRLDLGCKRCNTGSRYRVPNR
ncbi:MAG: hypothetical protein RLZZ367_1471, partial [Bacteroidota bacterium]